MRIERDKDGHRNAREGHRLYDGGQTTNKGLGRIRVRLTFAIVMGRSGAATDSTTCDPPIGIASSGFARQHAIAPLSPYRASRLGNLDAPLLNGLSTSRIPNANGWHGLVLVDEGSGRRGKQIAGHPVTAVSRDVECHEAQASETLRHDLALKSV